MIKYCLWCGNEYSEGMDGIYRSCWERYQFEDTEEEIQWMRGRRNAV
jgi:hypothetical protein